MKLHPWGVKLTFKTCLLNLELRKMGIREALEREGSVRSSLRQPSSIDEGRAAYQILAREMGRAILREADVPELLQELAKVIRLKSQDVEIKEMLQQDGCTGLELKWNLRSLPEPGGRMVYSSVGVIARPLTRDLIVEGRRAELLAEGEWGNNSILLEDAIVRAYRDPGTGLWSPLMIR